MSSGETLGGVSQTRRFARNALMLIAVNLFMRTVGVSFSVYLSSKAGAEVMGLHSLLMGVYGLFITLGCGGVHLGTTRLIAEALGQNDDTSQQSVHIRACVRRAMGYALICGCGAAVLLGVSAPWIGADWLGDERVVPSLYMLALSLPPLAASSCLSGYFTGVRRVGWSAAASVAAQFLRLGAGIRLLDLWGGRDAQTSCLAIVTGAVLSEWIGLLLTALVYIVDLRIHSASGGCFLPDEPYTGSALTKRLTAITVPVTLAACLRSGLVTIQHALIPRGLKSGGASWGAALASYGVLHGVVLPVVLFPSAFISSYAGLLVPEVAEARAAGDGERVRRIASRVVTAALIFSFGAAGIMGCLSEELGAIVCNSPEAGGYIRILAPLIPIMYVDSSVDGILKGMGEQVYSMVVNIIDALTSVILVWVLIPRMGLDGYLISIYVTETLNTTLSLCRMLTVTGMKPLLWRMVFGPLSASVGASWILRIGSDLLAFPVSKASQLAAVTAVGIAVYGVLLICFRVVRMRNFRYGVRMSASPSG